MFKNFTVNNTIKIREPTFKELQVFVNICAILAFVALGYFGGFFQRFNSRFNRSGDSRGYLAYSQYLTGKKVVPPIPRRTITYPFLLAGASIFGNYGILGMHFLFWISSLNLLIRIIHKVSKSKWITFLFGLIYLSNISLILINFHALTESTTIFFTVLFLYFFTLDMKNKYTQILLATFLMANLVLVRPNYLLLYVVLIILSLANFFIPLSKRKKALLILVTILPIVVQIYINYDYSGIPTVSDVSYKTFKHYYIADIFAYQKGIPRKEAVQIVKDFSKGEVFEFLIQNRGPALKRYLYRLVRSNLLQESNFTAGIKSLIKYTLIYNYLLFYTNLIILIIWGVAFLFYGIRNNFKRAFATVLPNKIIFLLLFYTLGILMTGFSYYQGDRLVLPYFPVCLVLQAYLISKLSKLFPIKGEKLPLST